MVMPNIDMLRIYFGEGHQDPHQVYSEFVGITRHQAKAEFFTCMSTQPLWVEIVSHHNRIRNLVNELAEEIN